ncbi:ribonuclease D [Antrihabitans sp. YC2-6]|nr:ribonuclease D [Antrihabitans sp. YC2-6]
MDGEVDAEPVRPAPQPLLAPADGVPAVITTARGVADAAAAIAGGTGPLAVDAERASGFRYSGRAYLIQLRRAGAGTFLIDPIPIPDALAPLADAINGLEWILHSADQDLTCLAELGLAPAKLFDTELAGRLAGFERVGLAAIVEYTLGLGLQKGHGAADWSARPLPDAWLNYAALDVEVLLELREAMVKELDDQGKSDWAAQEFEYIRTLGPPKPKADRWRRTSGLHTLKKSAQLATVRSLWQTRDRVAADRDIAPGRVLPDSAIVSAAVAQPKTIEELRRLPVFGGPRQRKSSRLWLDAIREAAALPASELPPTAQPFDGPPPINRWSRRDPAAANRLDAARAAMREVSEKVDIPVENLLLPDLLRRLCWDGLDYSNSLADRTTAIDEFLAERSARPWQRELAVPALAPALQGAASAAADSGAGDEPADPAS